MAPLSSSQSAPMMFDIYISISCLELQTCCMWLPTHHSLMFISYVVVESHTSMKIAQGMYSLKSNGLLNGLQK
ncbi:hypothetical protein FKM82_003829 [Ascaphus truei]